MSTTVANLTKEQAEYEDARSTLLTRLGEYCDNIAICPRPDETKDPEGAKVWDEVEELYGYPLRVAALTYFDRAKNEFKRQTKVMAAQLCSLILNGGDVDGWIDGLTRSQKQVALSVCVVIDPMIEALTVFTRQAVQAYR